MTPQERAGLESQAGSTLVQLGGASHTTIGGAVMGGARAGLEWMGWSFLVGSGPEIGIELEKGSLDGLRWGQKQGIETNQT